MISTRGFLEFIRFSVLLVGLFASCVLLFYGLMVWGRFPDATAEVPAGSYVALLGGLLLSFNLLVYMSFNLLVYTSPKRLGGFA